MIAYSVHASLEHNQVPIFRLKNWGILGVRRNASKINSLRPATLLKKEASTHVFPINFVKLLRIPF